MTNAYGVSIKPKLQDDKESFSLAFVNLDQKYLLPIRIMMISPDGKSKKDFQLGPMYPEQGGQRQELRGQAARPALEGRPQPGRRGAPPRGGANPARDAPAATPPPLRPRAGGDRAAVRNSRPDRCVIPTSSDDRRPPDALAGRAGRVPIASAV